MTIIIAHKPINRSDTIGVMWNHIICTAAVPYNYEDAKKQTLAKIGRIYDEILNRFQAASAVLHHNYTNFGTFSRKGALQSGVV